MSLIQREVPIKITFSADVKRPRKITQHIKRVCIEGPEDIVPEELSLDKDDIATGGILLIEDMTLPPDCYVIDRRGNDPIVTVEKQKIDKRTGPDKRGMNENYDD